MRAWIRMPNSTVVELPDDGRRFTDIVQADRWSALDATRALVFGGRRYEGREIVFGVLDNLRPELVIHGFCHVWDKSTRAWLFSGADRLADDWALERGAQPVRCPANWTRYDKGAGSIRNSAMAKLAPTIAVGFPGDTGTEDMARRIVKARVPLITVA